MAVGRPNPAVIFPTNRIVLWLTPFIMLWGCICDLSGCWGIRLWGFGRIDQPKYLKCRVIWGTPFVSLSGPVTLTLGHIRLSSLEEQRTYYAITNRRALIVLTAGLRRPSRVQPRSGTDDLPND